MRMAKKPMTCRMRMSPSRPGRTLIRTVLTSNVKARTAKIRRNPCHRGAGYSGLLIEIKDWMLVAPRYVPVAALACQPNVEIQPVSLGNCQHRASWMLSVGLPAQKLGMSFRCEKRRPVVLPAYYESEHLILMVRSLLTRDRIPAKRLANASRLPVSRTYMLAISAILAHVANAPKKATKYPYNIVGPPPLMKAVVKKGKADSQVAIIHVVKPRMVTNPNLRLVSCLMPMFAISAASRPEGYECSP